MPLARKWIEIFTNTFKQKQRKNEEREKNWINNKIKLGAHKMNNFRLFYFFEVYCENVKIRIFAGHIQHNIGDWCRQWR